MTSPSPLFILCPGRSFSSVVACMIGCHPQLYALPEVNLFCADTVRDLAELARRRAGLRFLLDGLLRTLAELQWGEQTEETVDAARAWLGERESWSTAQIYYHIAELAAPRRCVDKSPAYARPAPLQRLRETFPDAPILHLSRHPRSSQQSRHKALSRDNVRRRLDLDVTGADNLESYWYDCHKAAIEFIDTLPAGQAMYLRGEALLSQPDLYLPQIAGWLGVDTGPEAIDAMKHPERSPFARLGPRNAPAGHNRGFVEDPALRILTPPAVRLEGPLEWAEDPGRQFRPETIALARQLGYQ